MNFKLKIYTRKIIFKIFKINHDIFLNTHTNFILKSFINIFDKSTLGSSCNLINNI
jgi:hypothetical protein